MLGQMSLCTAGFCYTQLELTVCLAFCRRSSSSLLWYRNADKVAAARNGLSGKAGKISSYTCDLGSFSEIQRMTEDIKADFSSIDVLINNAGVFEQRKMLSKDGFEMTWAINVLAPFLLTSLLKDMITERIINVASISAGSRIDFDNLQQVSAKCRLLLFACCHEATSLCVSWNMLRKPIVFCNMQVYSVWFLLLTLQNLPSSMPWLF